MSALLTHSRLSTLRQCQQKERLRYVEGFRPVKTEEALRFGSLMHVGLEAWWMAHKDGHPHEANMVAQQAMAESAADEFERVKASELMTAYDLRWKPEMSDLEILGVESQFEIPLLNPTTWAPSRTYRLTGKVDAVARRRFDNRLLVVEHKTTSEEIGAGEPYWLRLVMDTQLSIYILGAESLSFKIDECLYDVIKKPALRPYAATPEAARKFTKDGRLYAVQHDHDETPQEFGMRLRLELSIDPGRYYSRKPVPRMNSQVEDFLADTWNAATQLRENAGRRAVKNPDACFMFGNRCAYWDACANGLDLSTSPDFYRLADVHPELSQEAENVSAAAS
jgi:PD-(D/E)XK nuclease superfamily